MRSPRNKSPVTDCFMFMHKKIENQPVCSRQRRVWEGCALPSLGYEKGPSVEYNRRSEGWDWVFPKIRQKIL